MEPSSFVGCRKNAEKSLFPSSCIETDVFVANILVNMLPTGWTQIVFLGVWRVITHGNYIYI